MGRKINKQTTWLLKGTIRKLVKSFNEIGYSQITEQEVWEYLVTFRWKRNQPETLSEMKMDIQKVTANDYFDYQQFKAVTKKDFDDLEQLF